MLYRRDSIQRLWARLRALIAGAPDDLREEIEAHEALEIEDSISRGLTPEAARRRFGNKTLIQEQARDAWRFTVLDNLVRDLRLGIRGVRRNPGFATLA